MSEINGNEFKERREYRRFRVASFLMVLLKPEMKNLGLVLDISKSGVAVKYLSLDNLKEKLTELDIFLPHNDSISSIPCLVVYDRLYNDPDAPAFSNMCMRLCGIRFGQLSEGQKQKLGSLLHKLMSIDKNQTSCSANPDGTGYPEIPEGPGEFLLKFQRRKER